MGFDSNNTAVTEGIRISVYTSYQDVYSNPTRYQYLFSYRVRIENKNDFEVQLLRRHWEIFDSSGEYREVEGEGVVGEQPILAAGQAYEYESACNLNSDAGKMHGTYLMRKLHSEELFKVDIPEFQFIAPYRLS